MENSISDIGEALQFVRQFDTRKPKLGLILGSGLGAVAELVADAVEISTGSIPGYPESTVAGHSGSLVIGELAGVLVAIVRGRVHCYEGHSVRAVAFPVRLLHGLGVRRLIVTNAAGGANPDLSPGSIMFIEDHINSVGKNPLVGPNLDHGPRFPDMSEPYDLDWISEAESIAGAEGIRVHRGVYLWTLGPSYETKAEVRAFATLAAQYTPEPTSTPELGIVPTDSWLYEYVFHEMKGIRYLTIWQGFIAENFTRVFAGQTWPNEALGEREIYYYGLLYIYTTIAGQTTRAEVRTEEETGPFRIIDATDDNFLTLESAGHGVLGPQRFLFNVATLELQLLAD